MKRGIGLKGLVMFVGLGAVVLGASGCIVEESSRPPPADTEIEFDQTINIPGQYCGGPLTSWTVTNRDTGDTGTAGCQQPVLFPHLAPNASYTFDITGYSGDRLCWQGSCGVTAIGYETSFADCHYEIQHLCGF
jgi:hypothetical protein